MATSAPPKNNIGIGRPYLKKVKLVKYLMYIHNQVSIDKYTYIGSLL